MMEQIRITGKDGRKGGAYYYEWRTEDVPSKGNISQRYASCLRHIMRERECVFHMNITYPAFAQDSGPDFHCQWGFLVCVCILCIERLRIGQFLLLISQLSCPNLI